MGIFVLVLTGFNEIGKKILNNNDRSDENADFGHFSPFLACFLPVIGLLRLRCQCPKLSMGIFVLVLTGFNEIGKKILNNNDRSDENADFGQYSPFLACFWPVMTLVSVFKALNEYICPSSDLIE